MSESLGGWSARSAPGPYGGSRGVMRFRIPRISRHGTSGWSLRTASGTCRSASPRMVKQRSTAKTVLISVVKAFRVIPSTNSSAIRIASSASSIRSETARFIPRRGLPAHATEASARSSAAWRGPRSRQVGLPRSVACLRTRAGQAFSRTPPAGPGRSPPSARRARRSRRLRGCGHCTVPVAREAETPAGREFGRC